jgi:hypothetical protein
MDVPCGGVKLGERKKVTVTCLLFMIGSVWLPPLSPLSRLAQALLLKEELH